MPWRGPEYEGEFPTLGYLVAEYIQEHCVIPDGNHVGEPYLLSDPMLLFLLHLYRIRDTATKDPDKPSRAFHYDRGGQLVEAQKWGKGPFAAAICVAEADGEVVFDGWDSKGEPVGRPWMTPWIQVTAVSEDQTDNTWRALQPMIELGDLKADIPDTGETRINLPGGGRIEPVTASARSRLGQRVTFVLQDETHSWTKQNGGRRLADNQRRNLAGMGGRFLETTNAWDPSEDSVAQATSEATAAGVYRMKSEAGVGSVRNKRDRAKMLKKVYDGSWWVDPERIDAEIVALIDQGDAAQAERFFLNRIVSSEDHAYDADKWDTLTDATHVVPDGALITIGADGARFDDALALIATEVATGYQWPLDILEAPKNARDDYEHDIGRADGVVLEAFERFNVWRAYVDPQRIEDLLDRWQGRWSEKRVIAWYTNRPKQAAFAVRRHVTAVNAGDLSHDGNAVFARHIRNAVRQKVTAKDEDNRQMYVISKDRPMSKNKMDAAFAAVLSWEARGDAIASGELESKDSVYEERGFLTL
jgi:hypothetical protein